MAAPVHFTVLGQVDDPAVYAALAAIQVRKQVTYMYRTGGVSSDLTPKVWRLSLHC